MNIRTAAGPVLFSRGRITKFLPKIEETDYLEFS